MSIEAKEGLFPTEEDTPVAHDTGKTLAHSLKGEIIPQQQKFRGLCIDELRKFARRWVEGFPDVPIQRIALYEYHFRWSQRQKRRNQDLRSPLYVVVFEIPGLQWPPTSSGSTNWPPTIEEINTAYPAEKNQHPWKDFLDEVDNIPGQRFKENSYFIYAGFDKVYDTTPASKWQQEWLFVAVDDVNVLPEYVDRNGPSIVLLPLEQEKETLTPSPKHQATAGKASPVLEQVDDEVTWTWRELEKITKITRKTIQNRARKLNIKFEERPPKRGSEPEKGLRESDWRRIAKKK
jgi:hypothetical protein